MLQWRTYDEIACDLTPPICPFGDGADVLAFYSLGGHSAGYGVAALLAIGAGFRALAFAALVLRSSGRDVGG